jgi:hypothetical protein
MKQPLHLPIILCILAVTSVQGQSPTPGAPGAPAPIPVRALKGTEPTAVKHEAPELTKFNLDFPGGTPEKATDRPLNVVIPEEYAGESIPPLRMTQVTVPHLFRAMELASMKTIPYRTATYGAGAHSYQQLNTSISFSSEGPLSDDSIYYFRGRQRPPDLSALDPLPAPVKVSRFYALTPYLEQGLKVEDITTAIQTGWKMLGEKETPSISFHQETKLLIAVGEPGKLETIDAVLEALQRAQRAPLPPPPGTFANRLNAIVQQASPPASGNTNPPPVQPTPVPKSAP